MKFMKSLRTVLLGVAIAAATLSSVEPASALGGCGPNRRVNPHAVQDYSDLASQGDLRPF